MASMRMNVKTSISLSTTTVPRAELLLKFSLDPRRYGRIRSPILAGRRKRAMNPMEVARKAL